MIFLVSLPLTAAQTGALYADLSGPAAEQFFNRNLFRPSWETFPRRVWRTCRLRGRVCLAVPPHLTKRSTQVRNYGPKCRLFLFYSHILSRHKQMAPREGVEGAGKEPHKGMEGRHQAVFSPGLPQYPEPASSCQDTAGRHVSSRPVLVPNKVFFLFFFFCC